MAGRILLLILVGFCATAQANEYRVSAFSSEGLRGWETKTFKGSTDYSLVRDDGRTVVRAFSKGTASGLFKKMKLDPQSFRYLRWSWKIADIVKNGDETTKAGDDYAARVYVVFPGRFFWQTRAINYIWANRLPKGGAIPNAFTSHAMMLAVESGSERAGQWLTEERDILADYRRLFGDEPHEIGAIAVMTDTDNTGGEATAWYGAITLSTSKSP
ncbi:DUF3047 domain-containing protein [Geobacter sp. AOG2]|uniref:DUF3047 domain-containing protein n=1 Tax=Geobacter sp. AOG2 TaxID=1566347 RepID=UPI001CC78BF1|nr:DUF3047 domain-containing protein [Geobacter sp. AOG2]GFE61152.1 hypothetical protein AOG2_17390 [Geobacter sp. AOG2]